MPPWNKKRTLRRTKHSPSHKVRLFVTCHDHGNGEKQETLLLYKIYGFSPTTLLALRHKSKPIGSKEKKLLLPVVISTAMRVPTSSLLQESLATGDLLCCWRDIEPFPVVLHRLLGNMRMEGNEHIISWNNDGKSFTIYEPKEFADKILTRYFKNQTRYKSFQVRKDTKRNACISVPEVAELWETGGMHQFVGLNQC